MDGRPHLDYQDDEQTLDFIGQEIDLKQMAFGILATVAMPARPLVLVFEPTGITPLPHPASKDWSLTDRRQVGGLAAAGAVVRTVDIRDRTGVHALLQEVQPDRVLLLA